MADSSAPAVTLAAKPLTAYHFIALSAERRGTWRLCHAWPPPGFRRPPLPPFLRHTLSALSARSPWSRSRDGAFAPPLPRPQDRSARCASRPPRRRTRGRRSPCAANRGSRTAGRQRAEPASEIERRRDRGRPPFSSLGHATQHQPCRRGGPL